MIIKIYSKANFENIKKKTILKENILNKNYPKIGSVLLLTNQNTKQTFTGLCIGLKKNGINSTVTLRNRLYDEGVEITFPLYSPKFTIKKKSELKFKKAKLYFLRQKNLTF
jgi:ribosomal protein L19